MGFLYIITSGILAVFSMFSQLIQYLISAPGYALYTIFTNWGQSFENYGIAIPIVFVLILAITGAVAYTLIETASVMNDAMSFGGSGGLLAISVFFPVHVVYLDEASYILVNLGNAIVQGLLLIIQAIVQGMTESFSGLIYGIINAFGIPFMYWSSNLQTNYILPIIFVIILGIALLILMAFIDAMGFEKDLGEGLADISELEL